MIYVVLDIETIAHPDAHLWLDPVVADKRLKDPEKIAADLAEKALDREKQLATHPDTCRIIALGYHVIGHSDDPHCLLMRDEYEERELLRQFADEYRALNRRNEVRFVTFYGSFDLPVLMSRAMYLDVDFPELNIDKFNDASHLKFDVHWKLSRKGAVKAHGLKFYAKRMGFTTLDKVDGSEIGQLFKDDDWNAIEAHCLSDVGLTHAIANRIGMLKV